MSVCLCSFWEGLGRIYSIDKKYTHLLFNSKFFCLVFGILHIIIKIHHCNFQSLLTDWRLIQTSYITLAYRPWPICYKYISLYSLTHFFHGNIIKRVEFIFHFIIKMLQIRLASMTQDTGGGGNNGLTHIMRSPAG